MLMETTWEQDLLTEADLKWEDTILLQGSSVLEQALSDMFPKGTMYPLTREIPGLGGSIVCDKHGPVPQYNKAVGEISGKNFALALSFILNSCSQGGLIVLALPDNWQENPKLQHVLDWQVGYYDILKLADKDVLSIPV